MPCRSNASNAALCAISRNSNPIRRHSETARLALALVLSGWTSWACADICRVTESGTALGDGSDWGVQALALQTALAAPACSEIWVKAGLYKPTDSTDQTISFDIRPGIAVYGGFDGTETTREERDPDLNVTILSGDIDDNDTDDNANDIDDSAEDIQGDNSHHVVTMDGTTAAGPVTASTVLDGFVVTAGDYLDLSDGKGAGLYCDGSGSGHECSPTLGRLGFIGNRARLGGAMFDDAAGGISSPVLEKVSFVGNFATNFGGALFNYADEGVSSPTLNHVVFSDNRASAHAGAMVNQALGGVASPVLTNVTFSGNSAINLGGAMLNNATSGGTSNPSLTNVTFAGNVAGNRAGAIYNASAAGGETSPTLVNVTFSGNEAYDGGAIYNYPASGVTEPTFRNVILWGDSIDPAGHGTEIYNDAASGGSAAPTLSFSIVEGGDAGSYRSDGSTDTAFSSDIGNVDADPLLGELGDHGGATPTLLPGEGSAAIDAGTNTECPATDQRGVSRPQGTLCDIGAVEVEVDLIFADGFEQG